MPIQQTWNVDIIEGPDTDALARALFRKPPKPNEVIFTVKYKKKPAVRIRCTVTAIGHRPVPGENNRLGDWSIYGSAIVPKGKSLPGGWAGKTHRYTAFVFLETGKGVLHIHD